MDMNFQHYMYSYLICRIKEKKKKLDSKMFKLIIHHHYDWDAKLTKLNSDINLSLLAHWVLAIPAWQWYNVSSSLQAAKERATCWLLHNTLPQTHTLFLLCVSLPMDPDVSGRSVWVMLDIIFMCRCMFFCFCFPLWDSKRTVFLPGSGCRCCCLLSSMLAVNADEIFIITLNYKLDLLDS